jgi:hypothetical protein
MKAPDTHVRLRRMNNFSLYGGVHRVTGIPVEQVVKELRGQYT